MKPNIVKIIAEDNKTVTVHIAFDANKWMFKHVRVTIPKSEIKPYDYKRWGKK